MQYNMLSLHLKIVFFVKITIIKARKIDGLPLETFGMVIAVFFVQDKLEKV